MTNDVYCDEALSGKTSIPIVKESDEALAFFHTRSYWPVPIVVIPEEHIPSFTDLADNSMDMVYEVLDMVRVIAADLEQEYDAARVLTNPGDYQDSKHLHFHVIHGEPMESNSRMQ